MRLIAARILPLLMFAFLATSLHPLAPTASAAEFTRLPQPEWTAAMPANTSTEPDSKNYYYLGDRHLPVVSDENGSRTAYTFLFQADRSSGKLKRIYRLLALDDATGKTKWMNTSQQTYNSFDMDLSGNAYNIDRGKSGAKTLDKLIALDSNGKQRWVKTFGGSNNYRVLGDGRIAVITLHTGMDTTLTLYSKEGKTLYTRKFKDADIRHIQGDYVGVVNYKAPKSTTTIEIYSISSGKKIATAVLPPEYFNAVHAEFDVLSGGTLLVPVYNAKTGVETLYGYAPDGKLKWSRVLPTATQNGEYGSDTVYGGVVYAKTIYNSLFVSVGNNYLVQEKNKLSLYDTSNRLIAAKTFDDLPGQGSLQRLGDGSIVFGATERPGFLPTKPEPKKAAFYVMDSRTLQVKHSLVMEDALFNQADVRFYDANTFYLDSRGSLTKYILK